MTDPTHDAALAAAVMLINLVQSSPGAATPELVSAAVVIIEEAIKAAEVFRERNVEPSVN